MKVIKFGGTSVGSANSILSVKRIVEAINEPLIVVVSALGGITDKLINTSKMAAAGDSSYENEFREIVYRHVEMIKEVIPAGEAQVSLQRRVGELLNELKDIFQGDLPDKGPLAENIRYDCELRRTPFIHYCSATDGCGMV